VKYDVPAPSEMASGRPNGREGRRGRRAAPADEAEPADEWGTSPVPMSQDRKDIARAINTSAEMGVELVVYGAQGAFAAADLLAAGDVPTLVNLDWPSAPRNGDPEAVPNLVTLRLWDRAATTPMILAQAGVDFAFYSGGMSDPADALAAARKAVAHGLSSADAIRAFTLAPAEIFGVADRLGSIEQGKIANLVMTDGDLFVDGTHVETVFVDGVKYDVPAPSDMASDNGNGRRGGRGGRAASDNTDTSLVPISQDRGAYRNDAVTFISNATVMTASSGTIEDGDIIVRDGKIAEVGAGLTAPSGARVVDGEGLWVIPGIIDAHSHMGAGSINEGTVNVSSMVAIQDVIEPGDVGLYRALAGGVTVINILHGSANPIGGQNAVIKLKWGEDADELLIPDAIPGIKFALGENTKRGAGRGAPGLPGRHRVHGGVGRLRGRWPSGRGSAQGPEARGPDGDPQG